ncbi:8201_t:CDS:1, partial [Cetraspora pellucida]
MGISYKRRFQLKNARLKKYKRKLSDETIHTNMEEVAVEEASTNIGEEKFVYIAEEASTNINEEKSISIHEKPPININEEALTKTISN